MENNSAISHRKGTTRDRAFEMIADILYRLVFAHRPSLSFVRCCYFLKSLCIFISILQVYFAFKNGQNYSPGEMVCLEGLNYICLRILKFIAYINNIQLAIAIAIFCIILPSVVILGYQVFMIRFREEMDTPSAKLPPFLQSLLNQSIIIFMCDGWKIFLFIFLWCIKMPSFGINQGDTIAVVINVVNVTCFVIIGSFQVLLGVLGFSGRNFCQEFEFKMTFNLEILEHVRDIAVALIANFTVPDETIFCVFMFLFWVHLLVAMWDTNRIFWINGFRNNDAYFWLILFEGAGGLVPLYCLINTELSTYQNFIHILFQSLFLIIFFLKFGFFLRKHVELWFLMQFEGALKKSSSPEETRRAFQVFQYLRETSPQQQYLSRQFRISRVSFVFHSTFMSHLRNCIDVFCECRTSNFPDQSFFGNSTFIQDRLTEIWTKIICGILINQTTEDQLSILQSCLLSSKSSVMPVLATNHLFASALGFVDELKLRIAILSRRFNTFSSDFQAALEQQLKLKTLLEMLRTERDTEDFRKIVKNYAQVVDYLLNLSRKDQIDLHQIKNTVEKMNEIEIRYFKVLVACYHDPKVQLIDGHFRSLFRIGPAMVTGRLKKYRSQINIDRILSGVEARVPPESTVFLICTPNRQGKLKIIETSHHVEQVIGRSEEALIYQSPNVLIPEVFHSAHNHAMSTFFRTGRSKILNQSVSLFVMDKANNMVPLTLLSQIFYDYVSNKVIFFMSLSKNLEGRNRILCDPFGQIIGATEGIGSLLSTNGLSFIGAPAALFFEGFGRVLLDIIRADWTPNYGVNGFTPPFVGQSAFFKDKIFRNSFAFERYSKLTTLTSAQLAEMPKEEALAALEELFMRCQPYMQTNEYFYQAGVQYNFADFFGQRCIEITFVEDISMIQQTVMRKESKSIFFKIILLNLLVKSWKAYRNPVMAFRNVMRLLRPPTSLPNQLQVALTSPQLGSSDKARAKRAQETSEDFQLGNKFQKIFGAVPPHVGLLRTALVIFLVISGVLFGMMLSNVYNTLISIGQDLYSTSNLIAYNQALAVTASLNVGVAINVPGVLGVPLSIYPAAKIFSKDLKLSMVGMTDPAYDKTDPNSSLAANFSFPGIPGVYKSNFYMGCLTIYNINSLGYPAASRQPVINEMMKGIEKNFAQLIYSNPFPANLDGLATQTWLFIGGIFVLVFFFLSTLFWLSYRLHQHINFVYGTIVFIDTEHLTGAARLQLSQSGGFKCLGGPSGFIKEENGDIVQHRSIKKIPFGSFRFLRFLIIFNICCVLMMSSFAAYYLTTSAYVRSEGNLRNAILDFQNKLLIMLNVITLRPPIFKVDYDLLIQSANAVVDAILDSGSLTLGSTLSIPSYFMMDLCSKPGMQIFTKCKTVFDGIFTNTFQTVIGFLTIRSPDWAYYDLDHPDIESISASMLYFAIYLREILNAMNDNEAAWHISFLPGIILVALLVAVVHIGFYFYFDQDIIRLFERETRCSLRVINLLNPNKAYTNSRLRNFVEKIS